MSYKLRNKRKKKNNYSLIKKMKKEKRIDEKFQITLSQLTLEEVIGLKLEQSSRVLKGRQFGLPIWRSLDFIVKEAILRWVVSASTTHAEAARFLGVSSAVLSQEKKKFNIENYFDEDND